MKTPTWSPWLVNLLLAMTLLSHAQPARAVGPNMLGNSGFEGGTFGYWQLDRDPYSVVKDPANAHSGSWAVKAGIRGFDTSFSLRDPLWLWSDTSYTCSVWCEGSGTVRLSVDGLGSATCVATVQWQQITLKFDTGKLDHPVKIGIGTVGGTGSLVYIDDLTLVLTDGHTVAFNPQNPLATGFKLIFEDEFNDPSTIDVNCTMADGYKWYGQGQWYPNTSPSMYKILPSFQDAKGVLEISDAPVSMGWNFSTTLWDNAAKKGYRGTVFLPGKGIYYEARIACHLAHIKDNSKGWSTFWSSTLSDASRPRTMDPPPWSFCPENMPMPGWPGKWETIENDIMEYNPSWGHPEHWDSTIHDWSSGKDCGNIGNFNAVVCPPSGTDYTQWHSYGQLWIPGTAENGWHGYRQVYFDGVPYQAICWISNQISATDQPSGSYLFSMCDGTPESPPLWRNLMIGGAMGGTPNTYFDYVRVFAVDPKASIKVVTAPGNP
jgi:hypothetical protein